MAWVADVLLTDVFEMKTQSMPTRKKAIDFVSGQSHDTQKRVPIFLCSIVSPSKHLAPSVERSWSQPVDEPLSSKP